MKRKSFLFIVLLILPISSPAKNQLSNLEMGLSYDDILLIPQHSSVLPKETNISTKLTRTISLNIPVISAAMDTVTEARLAIALAEEGGIGIIHKNIPIERQVKQVLKVKRHESVIIRDPITVSPETSISEVLEITNAHNISGVPVVHGKQLVGIVTNRDLRFVIEHDKPVSTVMTKREKLVTVKEGTSYEEEIINLLWEHRVEKILVINDEFELRGMITVKDIQRAKEKPNASRDRHGHLRVGAAVGIGAHSKERVKKLILAGVDVIVVDTAHGHSKNVLEMITWIKKSFPVIQVIGGNVATGEGAKALVKAGADAVKVGIGPGSICTTRIVTGVGVPQATALQNVVNALAGTEIPIIADGGIRYSGDICKALALGASCVMVGGLFAGAEESPGQLERYQGRLYKSYRGMGSISAMQKGSADRYNQDQKIKSKLVPEGIEGRVPYKGNLDSIVYQLMGGLRSCMGYLGCTTIDELQIAAPFIRISPSAMRESHVHDVKIVKEAPNYSVY